MPKAILEFNLPEDQEEFKLAVKGAHAFSVLDELNDYLRGKLKYSELTEEQSAIYEEIRNKLWELKNDRE